MHKTEILIPWHMAVSAKKTKASLYLSKDYTRKSVFLSVIQFPLSLPLVTPFASRTRWSLSYSYASDFIWLFPLIVGQTTNNKFSATQIQIPINICISTSSKLFSENNYLHNSQKATEIGPMQTPPKLQSGTESLPGGTVHIHWAPKRHTLPSFPALPPWEL